MRLVKDGKTIKQIFHFSACYEILEREMQREPDKYCRKIKTTGLRKINIIQERE